MRAWELRWIKLCWRWSLPLAGQGFENQMVAPQWYNYGFLVCYALVMSKGIFDTT